jgi:hypothetical protein
VAGRGGGEVDLKQAIFDALKAHVEPESRIINSGAGSLIDDDSAIQ